MGEVVYTAEVSLSRHRGPDRTAWLPAGEQVGFGVHGPVAEQYGADLTKHPPTSTTLDYLVAAAGG